MFSESEGRLLPREAFQEILNSNCLGNTMRSTMLFDQMLSQRFAFIREENREAHKMREIKGRYINILYNDLITRDLLW